MPVPAGQRSGRCKICQSPDRFRIELLLVSGVGRRAIAKKFGVSADAAWRHGRLHVSQEQRAQLLAGPIRLRELADRAAQESMSLLEYISMVRSTVLQQFFAAGEANDRQGVALLSARLAELFRLQGQFTGELTSALVTNTTVNNFQFTTDPEFRQLMMEVAEALDGYPEARRAVFAKFAALEGGEDSSGAMFPRRLAERAEASDVRALEPPVSSDDREERRADAAG
jgi:hypothetical protein